MKKTYFFLAISILSLIAVFYFFNIKKTPQFIPVSFNLANNPVIEVEIDKQVFLVKIDLGSKFQLSLHKTPLAALQTIPSGIEKWRDAQGRSYESPTFLIPKVRIGNLTVSDVIATQENDIYEANVFLWDHATEGDYDAKTVGSLGRPLLSHMNVLLDFPNARMLMCHDNNALDRAGIHLKNMTMIPVDISSKGIIVRVDTDVGPLRLVLDTGATASLLRKSHVQNMYQTGTKHGFPLFTTSQFMIEGNDFGSQDLLLYDITEELTALDGILGMDFLKKHSIYIDYAHQVIYVGRS